MLKSNLRIVFAAVMVISASQLIGCSRTPEAKAKKVVEKIDDRLDLNDQQKAELNKLKDEALADFHSMKAEQKAMMDRVQQQLESGKLDREALKSMAAEDRNKRAPVMDKWIDNVVTFHESLNDKQKQIVVKDLKKLRSEMHD